MSPRHGWPPLAIVALAASVASAVPDSGSSSPRAYIRSKPGHMTTRFRSGCHRQNSGWLHRPRLHSHLQKILRPSNINGIPAHCLAPSPACGWQIETQAAHRSLWSRSYLHSKVAARVPARQLRSCPSSSAAAGPSECRRWSDSWSTLELSSLQKHG